ncbi:putative transcription factor C2H2 family [Rosa chinensis]|uniref:Putative transcription factor C2H2 family n=1 Tax=Rosa chinensis TaxID=74649 RepID=A0A2P6R219_ROSCH|nr:putative transcription factor C2H2 family [Rosa chinensis]
MWKFIVQIATQLSWLFNYLLFYSFAKPYYEFGLPAEAIETLISTVHYESSNPVVSSEEECAVCLCKIGEAEEMRELRCAHLFHKACLDRWTDLNHVTCPLCRSFLAPPVSSESQSQIEVLRFRFCSFQSNRYCDIWWLR